MRFETENPRPYSKKLHSVKNIAITLGYEVTYIQRLIDYHFKLKKQQVNLLRDRWKISDEELQMLTNQNQM